MKKFAIIKVACACVMAFTLYGCSTGEDYPVAGVSNPVVVEETLNLDEFDERFSEANTREEKLKVLKQAKDRLCNETVFNSLSTDAQKEVNTLISKMEAVFTNEYDEKIEKNTHKEKNISKELIEASVKELKALKDLIHSEIGVVCSEDEAREYDTKINDVLKIYNDYSEENDDDYETTTSTGETSKSTTTDTQVVATETETESVEDQNDTEATNKKENVTAEAPKPQTTQPPKTQPPVTQTEKKTTQSPITQTEPPKTTTTVTTPEPVIETKAPETESANSCINWTPCGFTDQNTGAWLNASKRYNVDGGHQISAPDCISGNINYWITNDGWEANGYSSNGDYYIWGWSRSSGAYAYSNPDWM